MFINKHSNIGVQSLEGDEFVVPVIINNFNRLGTTKRLVEDLQRLGCRDIHILDNMSTFPALVGWYDILKQHSNDQWKVTVHKLEKNFGHMAIWESNIISLFTDYHYIAYTDSDIELNPNTPTDFLETMMVMSRELNIDKVGLAIAIDDLPDNPNCNKIKNIECEFWKKAIEFRGLTVYEAAIDTTFSIIRPTQSFMFKAARIAGNYTSRHIPFYQDWNNLSKEDMYILCTASETVSNSKKQYLEWLCQ